MGRDIRGHSLPFRFSFAFKKIAAKDRKDRKEQEGKKMGGRKMFLPIIFLPSVLAFIRGHSLPFRSHSR